MWRSVSCRRLTTGAAATPSTATTTTTSTNSGPRVLSRRLWEAHQRQQQQQHRHGAIPNQTPKSKVEDKPWPRGFQIAGYTMIALGIPYSLAWFVSLNAPVRSYLETWTKSNTWVDLLRRHFGHEEPNGVSYCDRLSSSSIQDDGGKDVVVTEKIYQLEDEPTWRERWQQSQVEQLEKLSVNVRVHMLGGKDDNDETYVEQALPGSLKAIPREIWNQIHDQKDSAMPETVLALEFGNVVVDNEDDQFKSSGEQPPFLLSPEPMSLSASPLTQRTYTYSLWHYVRPQYQPESQSASSTHDLDISRLQYEIQQLQHDLQDVHGTRDVDDMTRELQEKKSALRKLQWKRRFGMN